MWSILYGCSLSDKEDGIKGTEIVSHMHLKHSKQYTAMMGHF